MKELFISAFIAIQAFLGIGGEPVEPVQDQTFGALVPTSVYRDTTDGFIRPLISTDGFRLPSLTSQTCVGTDSDGDFQAGTCSGGSGGGTWATSTSLVVGQLLNYPLNDTDVVMIGSETATSSAEFWFDPNISRAFLSYASSTAQTITNLFASLFTLDSETFDSLTDDATLANNGGDLQVVDVTCTNCLTTTEVASADLATLATNVSDTDFGDVTVLTGAWAVEDDSHAHTGTTLSSIDISDDTNLTGGLGLTLTGDDMACDTASGSVFGCLSSTDWTTFNNKAGFAYPFPSAATSTRVTFSGGLDFTYSSSTIYSSFITASSTNAIFGSTTLSQLTFGGVTGSAWSTFCTSITGSAALCDGSDDGAGGSGGADFTYATDIGFGITGSATSTKTSFTAGIHASSTSQFANSTTSLATISNSLWIKDNKIKQHDAGFLDIQKTGSDFTLMRIRAPLGDSQEATLSLVNDMSATDAGVDEEFVDFYNENYGDSRQWGFRQAYSGTGQAKPFVLGHWNTAGSKDAGNKFIILPNGTSAFALATSTVNQSSMLHIASTSANFKLKVDDAPGTNLFSVLEGGYTTIATTTANYPLTSFSATAPQLALSAGAGIAQWTQRNAGGNLYFATTSVAGTATTSISAFEIAGDGFGTTTLRGLNIDAQATSTSDVGFNITTGCFAIGGTCIGGSGSGSPSVGAVNVLQASDGSGGFIATGTPQLTVGNLRSTTTSASFFTGGLTVGSQISETYQLVSVGTNNTTGIGDLGIIGSVNLGTTDNNTIGYQHGQANTSGTVQTVAGWDFVGNSHVVGAQSGSIAFTTRNAGSFGERMRINFDGKIGIGTTTPQWLLNPTSTTLPQLSLSNGAGINQVTFRNAGGSLFISTTTVAGTATTSTSMLEIATGGFGTTTLRGLNISGQATSTSNVGYNITGGCFAINNTCVGGGSGSGLTSYDAWTHPFAGSSATSTKFFGIGTTTVNASIPGLTVSSSTILSDGAGIAQWVTRNAGGNLYFSTTTVAGSATTSTAALSLIGSGKPGLAISSSSPFATLAVNPVAGDYSNQFVVGSSTATNFKIDNSGHIFVPSLSTATGGTNHAGCINSTTFEWTRETTGSCVVSSRRFKEDIKPLNLSGVDLVLRLKPVSFAPKSDDVADYQNNQIGLIAEDVAEVNPHFAKYGEDGLPRTLDDRALLSTVIKAIQELWQKITGVEDRVEKLEKENKDLKDRLELIENRLK